MISNSKVLITAHRGASGYAPENTIASIILALEFKSDIIEIDVQETGDGHVVLHHDLTLKRTAKIPKLISNLTLAELKTIDVGSWFNPKFSNERIPTLEEVVLLVGINSKLNIELKSGIKQKKLVEKVVEIVSNTDYASNCIITSFDHALIDKVNKLNPQIKTGYIYSIFNQIEHQDLRQTDILSVHHRLVSEKLIEFCQKENKPLHVWTINKEKTIRNFIKKNVASIITNFPDIAIHERDSDG